MWKQGLAGALSVCALKELKCDFKDTLLNYLTNNFCYHGEGSSVEAFLVGFCLRENTLRAF